MSTRKLALAVATGTVLLAAAPAFANPPHWAPAHGWRAQHGHHRPHYRPQRVVIVRPAPVYYYQPAPIYYAPPRPAYYAAPVYVAPRPVIVYRQPGVSVSFGL